MVQVSCTMASRVYLMCTLSAVLCIPKGFALGYASKPSRMQKAALRVQIPFTLQSHVQLLHVSIQQSVRGWAAGYL